MFSFSAQAGNMSGMKAFCNDFESTNLSVDECSAFVAIAKSACYPDLQHRVSDWLAGVGRAQVNSVCDHIVSQVQRAWRIESRM